MRSYVFFLLSLFIFFYACQNDSTPSKPPTEAIEQNPPLIVSVTQPTIRTTQSYLTAQGQLEAGNQATIFSEVSGFVDSIYVRLGDEVKEGTILLTLVNRELNQNHQLALTDLAEAQSDSLRGAAKVARAKAEEQLLKKQFDRHSRNYGKNSSTSASDLDEAEATWKIAKAIAQETEAELNKILAGLTQKKASLKISEEKLSLLQVTAPFTGKIAAVLVSPQTWSTAAKHHSEATPLIELVGAESLRAILKYMPADASFIKKGAEIALHFSQHPDKKWNFKITRTASVLSKNQQWVLAEIDLPELSQLYPGMHFTARHREASTKSAMWLPATTITERLEKTVVLVVKNETLKEIIVQVGQSDKKEVEVFSPELKEGDQVVTVVSSFLKDGMKVTVRQ